MRKFATLTTLVAIIAMGNCSYGDGVVDGQRGANYGSAVSVQTIDTQFGDNFSELNAAYAYCANDRLYMMITGNLEQNFNKLNIFIDSRAGGENSLSGTPDYDFESSPGNWLSNNYGGHTFDDGFLVDYHMVVRSGGGDNYEVDFIDRLGGGSEIVNGNTGSAVGLGSVTAGSLATNAGGSALVNDLNFFFDNSNTAGVGGGTGAADQVAAAAVATGFEFSIALSDLGLDSSVANQLRVAAIVGNGDHSFHSNQVLGGLPAGTGNLGGDGTGTFTGDLSLIDFNDFAGDQFITIDLPVHIPEPGSAAVLGLTALAVLVRRRK